MSTLGYAPVFLDRNGELYVDTDELRRLDLSGIDVGAMDDPYDDDEEDEYDVGAVDVYTLEDLEDLEIGRRNPARRATRFDRKRDRLDRRTGRRLNRVQRRDSRKRSRLDRRELRRPSHDPRDESEVEWGGTILTRTAERSTPGNVAVEFDLQHPFRAEDIAFASDTDGATVSSVQFGDRNVFRNPIGIPIAVFEKRIRLKGFLDGQYLRDGLTIEVTGGLKEPGSLSVILFGEKPNSGNDC